MPPESYLHRKMMAQRFGRSVNSLRQLSEDWTKILRFTVGSNSINGVKSEHLRLKAAAMSLELTVDDSLLLEKHRLERLRSFFADTLAKCFLHLDQNNTLKIHCSEPWIVDQLLSEIEQLRWYVWVLVGAQRLSICFAQEEVYRTSTRKTGKRSQRLRTA
jgi:hypothetical protein